MSTYKPPPTPWSRKLAGSSGFYMFLLASVVISSIYMIFSRSSQTQVEIIEAESIPVAAQVEEPEKPQAAVPRGGTQVATAPSEESILTQKFKDAAESLFQKSAKSEDAVVAPAPKARVAPTNNKVKITVRFLEVPQNNLATLFAGFGDSATGVVSEFSSHLAEARKQSEGRLRTLSSVEKNIETANVPIRFDEILNESTGLYIRVLPTSITENSANLDIHIEYRSPGSTGTPTVQDFDGSFSVPNAAAAYFADIMPRNPVIRPEDSELYANNSIFKILTTPTYLTNSTEFLIFFEVSGLPE